MADMQETGVVTRDVIEVDLPNLQGSSEDQAWWDAAADIDTSQPHTAEFLEAYIEAAGPARHKDRRIVVERFLLWKKGFTLNELAESYGIGRSAVRAGIRQVGHALMGTPLPPRADRGPALQSSLTEEQWREEILEAGLLKSDRANYRSAEDRPLSWQDDSLCAQTDPDAFIIETGSSIKEPKKICNSCSAQLACLAYALASDQQDPAIYGGLTETERTRFRNKTLRSKAA